MPRVSWEDHPNLLTGAAVLGAIGFVVFFGASHFERAELEARARAHAIQRCPVTADVCLERIKRHHGPCFHLAYEAGTRLRGSQLDLEGYQRCVMSSPDEEKTRRQELRRQQEEQQRENRRALEAP
ncbi:MAG: hypothetical protein AB2A00_14880 [Myxococcota bacterium]